MVNQDLPAGRLRLIDNRIVVGDSNWAMEQPTTVAILHPKQNKPEHRALIRALLDFVNATRAPVALLTPEPADAHIDT